MMWRTWRRNRPVSPTSVFSNEPYAKATIIRSMDETRRTVRVTRLHESGGGTDLEDTTPAERLSMMWQLALDVWSLRESPFPIPDYQDMLYALSEESTR